MTPEQIGGAVIGILAFIGLLTIIAFVVLGVLSVLVAIDKGTKL